MSFIDDFRAAVYSGLEADHKSIPCRYLYDERGSELFVEITRTEDYYLTRAEKEILREHGQEIAKSLPPKLSVVELGSGISEKTPLLLEALDEPSSYEPVDIDDSALAAAERFIGEQFPELKITPVHADFTQQFDLPDSVTRPVLGFFPGSTIGNFVRDDAAGFLGKVGDSLGEGAYLLIGADLEKDPEILERAYDDRDGVTRDFIMNMLIRINRELNADFDLDAFTYMARWNEQKNAISMCLTSKFDQSVTVDGREFKFAKGEAVHIEDSHKYSPARMRDLGRDAGWAWEQMWTDSKGYYSMHLLRRAA